jgi:2-amino-4-hydroxy-6-hydroxymethyldihydropteridine diphosphokinase
MSLIIATGTNQGNKLANLEQAKVLLEKKFSLIAASNIYESTAVDYTSQPDFFNQVLEFETPISEPEEILSTCLAIEDEMGRQRLINKGPRNIDIDVIFIDDLVYKSQTLQVPHPRCFERSFVVNPIKGLPCFKHLKKQFNFSRKLNNKATPIKKSS